MVNFVQLRLPAARIRHREDVARLRRILNLSGFDATDSDIQAVYSEWSERTHAAGWVGLTDNDDQLFHAVMSVLEPVRRVEA